MPAVHPVKAGVPSAIHAIESRFTLPCSQTGVSGISDAVLPPLSFARLAALPRDVGRLRKSAARVPRQGQGAVTPRCGWGCAAALASPQGSPQAEPRGALPVRLQGQQNTSWECWGFEVPPPA